MEHVRNILEIYFHTHTHIDWLKILNLIIYIILLHIIIYLNIYSFTRKKLSAHICIS